MIWCPEPEVRTIAQQALCELRVQKGHQNYSASGVALVRKFASLQAEDAGELPNRDTSLPPWAGV
jgi:hypothetical protein